MFTKRGVVILGAAAIAALASAAPAEAQVSGRVVFADGPIGVSIVFGDRPAPVVLPGRVVRRPVYPARYRPGMSLYQLDLYAAHIEREYEFYRRLHHREAYRLHGWSVQELRSYVKWLRDERKFLRHERRHLVRDLRGWDRDWDDEWDDWDDDWDDDDRRRRGRGRGR